MKRIVHKTARLCGLKVTCVLIATTGYAQDNPAQTPTNQPVSMGHIRIASWDLHDLWHQPGVALRSGGTVRKPSDFVALRLKARSLKADIVALQGLGSPRAARMLFPAREYFVIFSRELAIRQQRDRDILSNPARRRVYNAIAIRRAAKLRILAREQVLEMADPSPGLGAQRPQGQSALAVKVRINKKPVWVVSSRLLPGCTDLAEATDVSKSPAASHGYGKRSAACTAVRDQVLVLNAWKSRKVTKQDSVILAVAVPQAGMALKRNSAIPAAWKTLTTSDPVKVTLAYNARRRILARQRGGATRFVLSNPVVGVGQSSSAPTLQPNTVALTGPTRAPGKKLVEPAASSTSGNTNFVVDALSDFAKAALGNDTSRRDAEAKNAATPSGKTLAELSSAGLARLVRGTTDESRHSPGEMLKSPAATVGPASRAERVKNKLTRDVANFVRYPRDRAAGNCAAGPNIGHNFLLVDRALHTATKGLTFGTALGNRGVSSATAGARTDCAVTVELPRKSAS